MGVIAAGVVAAAEDRNPLIPPVFDIGWSLVVLGIIALVVVKFVLPKFNTIMDERTAKIEGGLAMAEKAKQESADSAKRIEAEILEARKDASKIREDASNQAEEILSRAHVKANEDAARILESAQRQIEAERQAAEISLKSEVGILAVELAEKIVGEQLKDSELSARVVDRFLDDLENQKTSVRES
ncbi:MAG: F0F1 ATP synthase subunit B [Actinomycetaceae bacterium]|nr:F0F1 ATP synthase subunit B [Actinomycetaceae bacterium]